MYAPNNVTLCENSSERENGKYMSVLEREITRGQRESVCCLLVLDSVASTPQWIRQQKPRDVVHKVCVFVCECVLGSPRAS